MLEGVAPNLASYNLLLTAYGRAGLSAHCYALFLHLLRNERLEPDAGVCGALLSAFARKGAVRRCRQIVRWMSAQGIAVGLSELCSLMKALCFSGDARAALALYEASIAPHLACAAPAQWTVEVASSLRMACHFKLIEAHLKVDVVDEEGVGESVSAIMTHIPCDVRRQTRPDVDSCFEYLHDGALQRMLSTLILLNEHAPRLPRLGADAERKMLGFLEDGLKRKRFGFWSASRRGGHVLDFHRFWSTVSVLVLRYFVHFERGFVEGEMCCDVRIIVGKGTHSPKDAGNSLTTIASAIMDEVARWEPSVRVERVEEGSILALNASDLKQFLLENENPFFDDRRFPQQSAPTDQLTSTPTPLPQSTAKPDDAPKELGSDVQMKEEKEMMTRRRPWKTRKPMDKALSNKRIEGAMDQALTLEQLKELKVKKYKVIVGLALMQKLKQEDKEAAALDMSKRQEVMGVLTQICGVKVTNLSSKLYDQRVIKHDDGTYGVDSDVMLLFEQRPDLFNKFKDVFKKLMLNNVEEDNVK